MTSFPPSYRDRVSGRLCGLVMVSVLAAAQLTAAARADVIFDSFGPNFAVDPAGAGVFQVSGGFEPKLAVRFVPAESFGVTKVSAYIRSVGGNGQSSIYAAVYADAGGMPGAAPVWVSLPVIAGTAGAVYELTTDTGGQLTAGVPHWVVFDGTISMGNAAVLHAGMPNATGTIAFRIGQNPWTVSSGVAIPAVRIEGDARGACCNSGNGGCVVIRQTECATLGLRYDGNGSVCGPSSCRACPGDFNRSGTVSTQDLFEFLAAYFSPCL